MLLFVDETLVQSISSTTKGLSLLNAAFTAFNKAEIPTVLLENVSAIDIIHGKRIMPPLKMRSHIIKGRPLSMSNIY